MTQQDHERVSEIVENAIEDLRDRWSTAADNYEIAWGEECAVAKLSRQFVGELHHLRFEIEGKLVENEK